MLFNRKVIFVKSDVVAYESVKCNIFTAAFIGWLWELKSENNKAYIVDFK